MTFDGFGCVVRTLSELKDNPATITGCFINAELLTGYNDVTSHFTPAKFNAGVPLRYTEFPKVNNK